MNSITTTTNVDAEKMFTRLLEYLKTPKFWVSLIIIVAAIVLWQVLKHVRKKYIEKNGAASTTISHVLLDIGRWVFVFIVLVALLQLNGINVTGLVTGLGVVSIIVGFALQDFLRDIIMGAHIMTDKFFEVGDVVRYDTAEGKTVEGEVISFKIRTTKIRLVDYQEVMTISNRNIDEITVLSDIFDLDINIPYHVDPAMVHKTLGEITEEIAKIEGITETMYKGTERFNESSVCYRIRYWTSPKWTRNDIRRAATTLVQEGMIKAGIPFAFNHLDVALVQTEGAARNLEL